VVLKQSVWLLAAYAAAAWSAGGQLDDAVYGRLKAAVAFVTVEFERASTHEIDELYGSGFLLNEAGYVLTAAHVVAPEQAEGKPFITVRLNSGEPSTRRYRAEVVAVDEGWDLALLRLPVETGPVFLELMDVAQVRETQAVVALGFPLGSLLETSSFGPNVSLRTGSITSLRKDEQGQIVLLEHSANTDQGSSGGPLVGLHGRVLGMILGQIRSEVGNPSTKFAVPANTIQAFVSPHCEVVFHRTAEPETSPPSSPSGSEEEDLARDFFSIGARLLTLQVGTSLWKEQKQIGLQLKLTLTSEAGLVGNSLALIGAPSPLVRRAQRLLRLLQQEEADGSEAEGLVKGLVEEVEKFMKSEAVDTAGAVNYAFGRWVKELSLGLIEPTGDRAKCDVFLTYAQSSASPASLRASLEAIRKALADGEKIGPEQENLIKREAQKLESLGRM